MEKEGVMTGKRIAAVFVAVTLLLAGMAFAGPDASRQYARRGADDAVEEGHRGDHQREGSITSAAGGQKDAGAELFESKCSTCHELSRPLGKTKDREGWTATVKRMQANGCRITDQEAGAIVDYLVNVRGPARP